MRVVGGKYKGLRFQPPKNFPSRPTTDYAKEALFNILQNRLEWEELNVLDLFAGTGSISLEFISRGVSEVVSIDKHRNVLNHLNKLKREVGVENWKVLGGDVFKWLPKLTVSFDVVFADPPFALKDLAELPDRIFQSECLNENGLFILEHGKEHDFSNHPKFSEVRNYGGVHFTFFEEA